MFYILLFNIILYTKFILILTLKKQNCDHPKVVFINDNEEFISFKHRGISVAKLLNQYYSTCDKVSEHFDIYVHVKRPCLNVLNITTAYHIYDTIDKPEFDKYLLKLHFDGAIYNTLYSMHQTCNVIDMKCSVIPHNFNLQCPNIDKNNNNKNRQIHASNIMNRKQLTLNNTAINNKNSNDTYYKPSVGIIGYSTLNKYGLQSLSSSNNITIKLESSYVNVNNYSSSICDFYDDIDIAIAWKFNKKMSYMRTHHYQDSLYTYKPAGSIVISYIRCVYIN